MRTNKKSVVDTAKTLFDTKEQNSLGLIQIAEFWTSLKISRIEGSLPQNHFGLP